MSVSPGMIQRMSMLERVLRNLCPCYFGRSDENETAQCSNMNKYSETKETTRSSDSRVHLNIKNLTMSNGLEETWKGALNIVQPQPIYAFPIDPKKSRKRNQNTLLKPPLYWKKTMKTLCSEGPPVFQQLKQKKFMQYENQKNEVRSAAGHLLNKSWQWKHFSYRQKKRHTTMALLKRSDTTGDLSTLPSGTTVDMYTFKSQSLSSLTRHNKKMVHSKAEFSGHPSDVSKLDGLKYSTLNSDWNCLKCRVISDVSHGVVLFTAAYFNKKKMFMINVNRLENLSKKGREGNSYYTVVKLGVLPSERYIKCTRILTNCSSPDVKQDFSFSVRELTGKVLRLSVFDASLQKQHEAIGHALLTLEDVVCDQPKKYRIKLYRRTQPHICPGNLALSLKYLPEQDKFTIVVEKGRNLSLQRDKNVKLNTYVKVTLYAFGEKVKMKKSLVVLDSRDPNYNSTFTFQVRTDQVDNLSVAVAVRLKGFVNDITIGRLNFGPFFYVENQKLTPWGRVFLRKETVFHWYRMYL